MSAYERLKFELGEYLRLYDAGLKKRANEYLKGAVSKFKSEFSEAERDYALGELCREILDENQSELKNLKSRGNGELPFELGELVGEYLKKRCIADEMPHLRWAYQIYTCCLRGLDKNDLLRRAYRGAIFLHAIRRARLGGAPLSGGLLDRARILRATNPRSLRRKRKT